MRDFNQSNVTTVYKRMSSSTRKGASRVPVGYCQQSHFHRVSVSRLPLFRRLLYSSQVLAESSLIQCQSTVPIWWQFFLFIGPVCVGAISVWGMEIRTTNHSRESILLYILFYIKYPLDHVHRPLNMSSIWRYNSIYIFYTNKKGTDLPFLVIYSL